MDCSQIFPGAINPGPCSLATGYCSEIPFIVYASGKDLVILDGRLGHIQTVLGSDCGYGDTRISCVHCATFVGKIAVGWGSDVVVFEPEPLEEGFSSSEFPGRWCPAQTLTHSHTVLSLCWNREGTQLLTGGESIILWNFESYSELGSSDTRSVEMDGSGFWKEVWQYKMALPVVHLKFSSDGTMFASAAENDCLVKIWYSSLPGSTYVSTGLQKFSFVYIAHPCAVTGFVWRKTSPFMPKGCVANVLLTYCKDNICRFWSHSLQTEKRSRFRFFISASIDPFADIPFRTTMPINNMPFLVHWLNNKEATFTNMAEKTQRGAFLPPSRHSSLASFASSINEEMLQSWVCIEDMGMGIGGTEEHNSDPASSDNTGSGSTRKPTVYSFSNFLTLASLKQLPPRSGSMSPSHHDSGGKISASVRMFTQLMEEWNNSPDLLLCIHPFGGALMVWTVEGLDAPPNSAKLVHVSFSSCLPHMFPPHLAQSLRQELLQFIVKQPDAVTRDVADASFPVPQIRLPGGGLGSIAEGMSDLTKEEVMKSKPDSTLILVSNHLNGSLNTWSVELTANSTSIAGLIHCGGTGGHHSEVRLVHRHPWLPVLMTVSSDAVNSEEESGRKGNGVESELIIWNADLPGPLEHKSSLNELSRMSSTNPLSFRYVTWVPPISVGSSRDGAFARCPSSGLFLANVGNELLLYQTSLYSITKPQPTNLQQDNFAPSSAAKTTGLLDPSLADSEEITITSHLGKEGISVISVIEKDLSSFEQIISLYAFRMCSLITSSDAKISADSQFCKDIIITLIENRIHSSSTTSPGLQITNSYLHLWRVVICSQVIEASSPITGMWEQRPAKPPSSLGKQPIVYSAAVEKVFSSSLPLPAGVHVEHSSPACDVPSSLQLQLPTISAPFLFTTACSDGTIRCWQFTVKSHEDSPVLKAGDEMRCVCEDKKEEKLAFELCEVFGAYGSHEMDMSPSASVCLDCYQEDVLKTLPLSSHIPSAISGAYPGRFAMAHLLSRPASPTKGSSPAKVTVNPLGRYAVVSVWECESSGGLKWSCEATLMLSGLGIVTTRTKSSRMNVLLEWLPMENGAYLLATCFASIISIFGMALPQAEGQFTTPGSTRMSSFLPTEKLARLTKQKSQASWVCLLQFPCAKPYPGLSISCFAYTGSNSLLYSIGSEMHLYSCWVKGSRLEAFTPSKEERKLISKTPSRVFRVGNLSKLTDDDIINLLDYAHARNTPLPQYHPKILTELMNSGKLQSVKAILVNLVKYLLLYEGKWKKEHGSFDEHEYEYEEEVESKRHRLLSVSVDGHLKRSRKVKAKISVESIPPLSLSKLGIFTAKKDTIEQQPQQEETDAADQGEDDYDELFSTTLTAPSDDFTYGFESEVKVFTFTDLDAGTTDFTPDVAQKLSSILHYAQLADLSDLEQVRLLALAETVANTKLSFSDQTGAQSIQASTSYNYNTDLGFSTSGMGSGAGYAAQTLSHGVKGGEAMDDCGLRYLLALENYVTLSESLPKGVSPGRLLPSEFMWAFHSDAETELLATIPCVQKDELSWEELRNVGVGWWLRSSDTLRRLIEKLAKTQFMQQQDPLDASLFYLAMKKKTLVKGLFKTVSDSRMMKFFSNDFTQERWRKAALKNAFALLSKQRFEHAAAFFLLGDKLWDAAEVCVSRLGDLQLAFVITRLYEGDGGAVYERLLKEYILGVNVTSARPVEASPDPFLRSIAHWLLQDYSRSLETLLILPSRREEGKGESRAEHAPNPDPAIFNFYFFLRLHPLLIRRDYDLRASKTFLQTQPHPSKSPQAYGHPLSGVGDEPLTPAERNLLFKTSYYYLVHGCPLLALNVLSKLPKSCSLGTELCDHGSSSLKNEKETLRPSANTERELSADSSMTDMILSGTLDDFSFGGSSPATKRAVNTTESDFDWSKPVSSKLKDTNDVNWSLGGGDNTLEDEFDWSKPVSLSVGLEDDNEDIDWSKPVSNRRMSTFELPPGITIQSPEKDEPLEEDQNGGNHKPHLSTQGLFTLSLAEQLEYNACLSILTEELNTIYIPACCQYLWEKKGKDSLPLLPLIKRADHRNLAVHYFENTFVKTVLNLRGMLVEWLRDQTKIVKEICGFELVEDDLEEDNTPAGYDLLTTLMNYTSLHAATTPTLLTIKLELMHLMNTLLPWSTGSNQIMLQDLDVVGANMPTCAVDPAQVPILTSCSLPAKHLTNLALHLRLMSASIVETLATHSLPPIQTNPLPHVEQMFELCCAISHCINVCLSPMRLAELASSPSATTTMVPGIPTQYDNRTPKGSPMLSSRTRADSLESSQHLDLPNTKASKWPGVPSWPNSLSSDEGKDPTPLSLILVECCITVYMGLLSVAWSWHSISDLLLLIQNAPSQEMWYSAFGGGVDVKKGDEKGKRSGSKSLLMQRMTVMTKRLRTMRRTSSEVQEGPITGLFIAPKKTLLDHYLSSPSGSEGDEESIFEPDASEDSTTEAEESGDYDFQMEEGPRFRVGSIASRDEGDHNNPNSFAWCLMNVCISKLVQEAVRKILTIVGLEVLELVTASPLLYSALKVLEEWESVFTRRLEALGEAPDDLFRNDDDDMFKVGPALMRHKFILEPDNSPFRSHSKAGRQAKQLWQYLVHQETVRETFIHYIFTNKRVGSAEDPEPACRIIYKEPDSIVSAFCFNSSNPNVLALAVGREVLEISIPDTTALDYQPCKNEGTSLPAKRHTIAGGMSGISEDFVMIQSLQRQKSTISRQPFGMHTQTGGSSSMLLKRYSPGTKNMATHPNLAYYLTGSIDGSVVMWEFGTPKPVSLLRNPGTAPSVTRIRFTPQGNKYGVADASGRLNLWQGIHTSTKTPYQTLTTGMFLSDFLFLGSSSFIATCGEGSDQMNLLLWDTLLPPKSSVVREYMCHDGGATTLGYSRMKQRLFCGGKKGEICIFDIRQYALLQCIPLHSSMVNCILVNDVDGYFVSGSADGDLKVMDLTTVTELASFPGEHAKSRLFRLEHGVTDMCITLDGKLYSSGTDGTIKCRNLDF